jgi:DNA-binding LacI/PurR family transcriptional regulator
MAVTMRDVAEAAGVSTATVSNVINGVPRVGTETRLRVLDTMKELGYQVNPSARNLRSGRTDAIGLIVPELDRPYFGQLATRLADGIERHGRHLLLQRSGATREGVLASVALGRLRMYDGVVVSVVGLNPRDLERLHFTTPVVLIGERQVPRGYDHVVMDNVGGARSATAHLLEGGARRIVLLGGRRGRGGPTNMVSLRTRGYRAAHAEAGMPVDHGLTLRIPALTMDAGREALLGLARSGVPFDGVFALTDVVAMGAMRALAELGMAVPDDVQIVGFDNIDEGAFLVPSLTTVDPGNEAMAQTIIELLESGIGQRSGSAQARERPAHVKFPAQLVVRESTLGPTGQRPGEQ